MDEIREQLESAEVRLRELREERAGMVKVLDGRNTQESWHFETPQFRR